MRSSDLRTSPSVDHSKKRSLGWIFGIWLVSLPMGLIPSHTTQRLNLLEFVPCFLPGVIAWRIIRQCERRMLAAWLWPVALAILTALWVANKHPYVPVYMWSFGIVLGLLVPFFQDLSWKPLNRCSHVIAKYSYGIYLVHPLGLLAIYYLRRSHPGVPVPLCWAVGIGIVVVVPVVLYHCLEQPLIRIGRRVGGRMVHPEAAPMAQFAT